MPESSRPTVRFLALVCTIALTAAGTSLVEFASPAAAADRSICRQTTIVCGLDAPEDIVPVDGGATILASSLNNGGLYAVDARTHAVTKLDIASIAERPSGMYPCLSLHASGQFVTHGLNVKPGPDGSYRLYVVRHGGRQAIEIFRFAHGTDVRSLQWLGCVRLPAHFSGNAVVGLRSGGFFTTSMTDANPTPPQARLDKLYSLQPSGAVLEWLPNRGYRSVETSTIAGPNGIEVSPDEKWLYVDAWASRAIWKFSIGPRIVGQKLLDVPFMPDNLRWTDDGRLFSAGVFSSERALLTCADQTTVGKLCATHWGAVEFDPATLAVSCRIDRTGPIGVGDVSTALKNGATLWLASFDNVLLAAEPNETFCGSAAGGDGRRPLRL